MGLLIITAIEPKESHLYDLGGQASNPIPRPPVEGKVTARRCRGLARGRSLTYPNGTQMTTDDSLREASHEPKRASTGQDQAALNAIRQRPQSMASVDSARAETGS